MSLKDLILKRKKLMSIIYSGYSEYSDKMRSVAVEELEDVRTSINKHKNEFIEFCTRFADARDRLEYFSSRLFGMPVAHNIVYSGDNNTFAANAFTKLCDYDADLVDVLMREERPLAQDEAEIDHLVVDKLVVLCKDEMSRRALLISSGINPDMFDMSGSAYAFANNLLHELKRLDGYISIKMLLESASERMGLNQIREIDRIIASIRKLEGVSQ